MQYRYTLPLKKELLRALESLLRVAVFIAVLVYLYLHFASQELVWNELTITYAVTHPLFWITVGLVPVNLGFEALKWQYLLSLDKPIPFFTSYKGILAGLAFGLVTPHAVGDYAGRLMAMKRENKMRYVGPLMLSRISQLTITLLFGGLGVYWLFGGWAAIACSISAPVMLYLSFVFSTYLRVPGWKFITLFFDGLKEIHLRQLMTITGLSFLRYLIFATQFILLLLITSDLDFWLIVAGVTWIFLAKSVLPSINFLGDLGIREFSAVYFFTGFTDSTVPVVMASLLIWVMNIAVPAALGSVFLIQPSKK